jgi:sterol desaturase/sphingolipid hydroxylase (fatty acid hydroxylase superfamily)
MLETIFTIIFTVVIGAFIAEFLGYLTHILLHSNKIEYLSRNHMIHHLVLYGPKVRMRSKEYLSPVKDRIGIFGVGFEWLLPIGLIALVYLVFLWWLSPPLYLSIIFLAVNIFWVWFFYGYMHHAMHIQGFWMIKNKLFGKWFMKIRSFHDIHHLEIANDGRMNKNYGICFFMFDKIFRTFSLVPKPFNEKGYVAAEKRYDFIYKQLHK